MFQRYFTVEWVALTFLTRSQRIYACIYKTMSEHKLFGRALEIWDRRRGTRNTETEPLIVAFSTGAFALDAARFRSKIEMA